MPTFRSPWGTGTTAPTTWSAPTCPSSLDLPGGYRYNFLEFERRSATPQWVRPRLENYRRYFRSSYVRRDHGGGLPLVMFVFETEHDEDAYLDAGCVDHVPFSNSNLGTIARRGIVADRWLLIEVDTGESLTLRQIAEMQLFQ